MAEEMKRKQREAEEENDRRKCYICLLLPAASILTNERPALTLWHQWRNENEK